MVWGVLLNELDKPVKQVPAVMGPCIGLRVKLNRKNRLALESNAGHCSIVQVFVGHH